VLLPYQDAQVLVFLLTAEEVADQLAIVSLHDLRDQANLEVQGELVWVVGEQLSPVDA